MPDQNPVASNDALDLEFIDRRIGIETLIEREPGFLIGDKFFDGIHDAGRYHKVPGGMQTRQLLILRFETAA